MENKIREFDTELFLKTSANEYADIKRFLGENFEGDLYSLNTDEATDSLCIVGEIQCEVERYLDDNNIHYSYEREKTADVRCNWCMKEFEEKEIIHNLLGKEICPHCGESGFLMDIEDKEVD